MDGPANKSSGSAEAGKSSSGQEADDFTDDPRFGHIRNSGLLMTESRKKEIFREALRLQPQIQDQFNSNYIDHDPSNIGVFQWRLRDGRLIWSPGMFKLFGRDPNLGVPNYDEAYLKFIDGIENDKYLAEMAPVMEGKADSACYTMQCVRPGGEQYSTSGVVLPVIDEDGEVTEVCGYLKDDSAHHYPFSENSKKGSEEENEQEDERILELAKKERMMHQKAMVDKNNFIAYVFHEVRNPINAVYLGLQALADEVEDPDLLEVIGLMQNSTERAVTILNDTLDYSKFELGTVHLTKVLVPISEFLDECIKGNRKAAQEKKISITLEEGYDSVCELDKARMMQVLNNLFSNAIKFTPTLGSITVKYDHIDGVKSIISVSDTGPGIREEDQHRIFEPYNQIDNPNVEKKGMGIGLSISRKIADAHYGDLTVSSVYGQGSTFTVTIPAVKRIEHSSGNGEKRVPGELNGLNVLVVDDDAVNRIMLNRVLKKHGCQTASMKDGDEFLEWTRDPTRMEYDVVLLDDFMPKLDGSEALRIAREEGFKGCVLMLTGNMQKIFTECGADDVFYKPLKFKSFKDYVKDKTL